MSAPKSVITVIREWLAKADNDLKAAAYTLTLGKDCPTDTVCFHAQQCVEKYIKALLVWRASLSPKRTTFMSCARWCRRSFVRNSIARPRIA